MSSLRGERVELHGVIITVADLNPPMCRVGDIYLTYSKQQGVWNVDASFVGGGSYLLVCDGQELLLTEI